MISRSWKRIRSGRISNGIGKCPGPAQQHRRCSGHENPREGALAVVAMFPVSRSCRYRGIRWIIRMSHWLAAVLLIGSVASSSLDSVVSSSLDLASPDSGSFPCWDSSFISAASYSQVKNKLTAGRSFARTIRNMLVVTLRKGMLAPSNSAVIKTATQLTR